MITKIYEWLEHQYWFGSVWLVAPAMVLIGMISLALLIVLLGLMVSLIGGWVVLIVPFILMSAIVGATLQSTRKLWDFKKPDKRV